METRQIAIALARFAAFALLVYAGDRLLAGVLSRGLVASELRFSVMARGDVPSGILILGDSRGVNGFYAPEIARATGEPVFNLAYNGVSLLTAEALLRDWLARNPAPRLLVLEATNAQDGHDLAVELACYWSELPAVAALGAELEPRIARATRIARLFAFHGEIPLRALYYARRSDQDWINRYRITPQILAAARADEPVTLVARPENLAALARVVSLAREHRIELRVAVTPYLPDFFARIANYPEFVAEIQTAARPETRVWDYAQADTDWRHFADRLHLNDLGAAPFVARLVQDGFFAPPALRAPGVAGAE